MKGQSLQFFLDGKKTFLRASVVDYKFKGNDLKKCSITWGHMEKKKSHWICSENNDFVVLFTLEQNEAYNVLQRERWQSTKGSSPSSHENDGQQSHFHKFSSGPRWQTLTSWGSPLSNLATTLLYDDSSLLSGLFITLQPQPAASACLVMFAASALLMEHLIPSVVKALLSDRPGNPSSYKNKLVKKMCSIPFLISSHCMDTNQAN